MTPIRCLAARVLRIRIVGCVCALSALGCEQAPTSDSQAVPPILLSVVSEGEFFGNVYVNGQKTASTSYTAWLEPFDSATANRLHTPHSNSMWADPTADWMYEWFDPADGQGCGSLALYLVNDTSTRQNEKHRPGSGQPPPANTAEKHCIRPGIYDFFVAGRGFRIDYLQLAANAFGNPIQVSNTTAGVTEVVEDETYTDSSGPRFKDYIVHVDLTPGSFTDVATLHVENVHDTTLKLIFSDQPTPAGTELDVFRFSTALSSSTWNLAGASDPRGRKLARLFWDYATNKTIRTNYYDPFQPAFVIRTHRFVSHVLESRNVSVGLELMRPNEASDTLAGTTRTIAITRVTPVPPTACATFERTITWRTTDQYLSAGCSTVGSNIQYRWQFQAGAAWTSFSADTLYDFLGHSSAGSKQVILEARNTSTGASGFDTTTVSVQSGQIVLTGQTYITVKTTYTYTSNLHGTWYERFNPSLTWVQGISNDSMNRVWPAGGYTRELRQDSSTAALLRRGRLSITVCIPVSSCGPALVLEGSALAAVEADAGWSLFGGGPWISWGMGAGAQALRLYDLLGDHATASRFTSPAWLDDSTGALSALPGGWTLGWRRRDLGLADVQAIDFTIAGGPSTPNTFGLALDADIGPNPADDLSGYDPGRGLVTARDGAQAVGYLLPTSSGNALASIQQYGVDRWAPTTPAAAAKAQRQRGTQLLIGPRDVQFVLSAPEATGPTTYTLVLVRGRNVPDLQAKADAAIAALDQ